jgi:hypothetical protein
MTTAILARDVRAPSKLNHCPVIQSRMHARCFTVMMEGEGQYIVATWWPDLGSTWSWGHYSPFTANDQASKDEAHRLASRDFEDAAKRNIQR